MKYTIYCLRRRGENIIISTGVDDINAVPVDSMIVTTRKGKPARMLNNVYYCIVQSEDGKMSLTGVRSESPKQPVSNTVATLMPELPEDEGLTHYETLGANRRLFVQVDKLQEWIKTHAKPSEAAPLTTVKEAPVTEAAPELSEWSHLVYVVHKGLVYVIPKYPTMSSFTQWLKSLTPVDIDVNELILRPSGKFVCFSNIWTTLVLGDRMFMNSGASISKRIVDKAAKLPPEMADVMYGPATWISQPNLGAVLTKTHSKLLTLGDPNKFVQYGHDTPDMPSKVLPETDPVKRSMDELFAHPEVQQPVTPATQLHAQETRAAQAVKQLKDPLGAKVSFCIVHEDVRYIFKYGEDDVTNKLVDVFTEEVTNEPFVYKQITLHIRSYFSDYEALLATTYRIIELGALEGRGMSYRFLSKVASHLFLAMEGELSYDKD